MPIWIYAESQGYITIDRAATFEGYKNNFLYAGDKFNVLPYFPKELI